MFRTFFSFSQALKPRPFSLFNYHKPVQFNRLTATPSVSTHGVFQQPRCMLHWKRKPESGSNTFSKNKFPVPLYHRRNDLFKNFNKGLNALTKEVIKLNNDNNYGLTRITNVEKEELGKIIQKIDASANSRLTIFAGYATILSLLLAILIFAYQQKQEREKEEAERKVNEEKIRRYAEKTQAKIEKIQLKYSKLLTTKSGLEDHIKNVEDRLNTLIAMKKRYFWFVPSETEMGILKLQGDLDEKKIALQVTLNEINKLEWYVQKQKELEEIENSKGEDSSPNEHIKRKSFR